jgi:hypothetical protein
VLKKLRETRVIPLLHVTAQDFTSLLPPELAGSNLIRIDKAGNTLILSGTTEEVEPVAEFAALIDRPREGLPSRRFDLSFLSAQELLPALPPRFAALSPAALPGGRAIAAWGPEESLADLGTFIAGVDRSGGGFPVRLRYIRIEDLMKNLPPSAQAEDIADSGYPNLIFFRGSGERRELFMKDLELIDRPRPQIRYELLVIEYLRNRERGSKRGLSATPETASREGAEEDPGERPGRLSLGPFAAWFMGSLSNILSLNFDVVSQFGYQFALTLSSQLGENSAQVYADTTLNGISGQEIRFQNTDTYRYQEFEVDPDTGRLIRSGVTREISSGLIVSLSGWVSGDDMITVTVNATVSKQNRGQNGEGTGIPSTSERIITTQVRTPSGRPVVLSGLIKNESAKTSKRIPILGDIPLLRRFFGEESSSRDQTEIVIYIVPYLLHDERENASLPSRFEQYYRRFFGAAENGETRPAEAAL